MKAIVILAVLALGACAAPSVDTSPVGQFGIVRAPPIGCSETTGRPWNAASWVAIWDGDTAQGFGYCRLDGDAGRVTCVFRHCERLPGDAWRCGAPRGAR